MKNCKVLFLLRRVSATLLAFVLLTALVAGFVLPAANIRASALGSPSSGVLFNSTFSDMRGLTRHMGNADSMDIVNSPGGSGDGDLQSFETASSTAQNRVSFTLSDSSVNDYIITLNATYLSGGPRPPGTTGGFAIFYRAANWGTSSFNAYSFQFDPGLNRSFVIRRWTNNGETVLHQIMCKDAGLPNFVCNDPHEIVIKAIGNRHQVFIDGIRVFNFTNDTYLTGGVGLRTWNNTIAHFHDVKVEAAPAVTIAKTLSGFNVDITGWTATHRYQIWTYQRITGDLLLDASERKYDQWILSMPFTLGSEGVVQDGGSIRFLIDDFESSTDNYAIAVRIADSEDVFIAEMRDSYTSTELGEVVIDSVIVDGTFSTGREFKEINSGSQVHLSVICNDVENIIYSANATSGTNSWTLTASGNEFIWDTAGLAPAEYAFEITATNAATTATQTILFRLYSMAVIDYGVLNSMSVNYSGGNISITPDFENGTFSYRLREPGRTPFYRSTEMDEDESGNIINHSYSAPGIYHVYGYTTRAGIIGTERDGYDDGMIRTLVIPRTGSSSAAMTFTANQPLPDVEKETPIVFTANATGLPDGIEYSFWRYDATGYTLVKDWSTSNTLSWTPARIGEYAMEARAKGAGAGSYEVSKQLLVNVTAEGEEKASISDITINQAYLEANAQAKKPVMITANASSTNSEDLLYKFYVYDPEMRVTRVRDYSVNPTCIWTPRKADMTYTISVLVKNSVSFGKYDAIEAFEVMVDS